MKYLLGFLFISLLITSGSAFANVPDTSPNLIPPECKDLAMSFIIAGKEEYDSTRLGARLWSIARLEKAVGQSSDENSCLSKIWEQGNKDESDYWKHIAKRHHCLDSTGDNLPDSPPEGCPSGVFLDIANNLAFLKLSGSIHDAVQNGSTPGHCLTSSNSPLSQSLRSTMQQGIQIAQIASNQKAEEHRDVTFDSGMDRDKMLLGSEVALADAEEIQTCRESARDDKGYLDESKLRVKYQSDEYKKSHPDEDTFDHVVDDIADCGAAFVKNFFQSIWDDIWGLLKLVWKVASAPVIGAYKLAQAEWRIGKALCNGASIGQIVRQEWSDGASMKKKLMDYLNQAYVALKSKLAAEYTQLGCFNQKGNTEKVCSIIGYMGPDIIMLIPGFQEFAVGQLDKLEQIPKLGEAIRAVRIYAQTAIGVAAKIVAKPVKLVGEGLMKILKLPMRIKWVRDIASGFKIAVFGDEVVLQDVVTHEFFKPNPGLKERLMAALDKKFLKKEPLIEEPPAMPGYRNPQKDVFRAVIDKPKDLAQRAYKRLLSPTASRERALAANAEHAANNVAKLPKNYLVLDSAETHMDPNLIDIGLKTFQDALAKEQEAAAKFLDLTPAPENGANYRYLVKDPEVTEPLYRVQTADTNYSFQTEDLLKTPKDALGFPVYVDVDPAKLRESLGPIMEAAEKSGSKAVQVAGDSTTMVSGQRVTVYFKDPISAKNFMKNIGSKSSLGAVRDASLKSTLLKATYKVVVGGMIARCSGAHDHQCYCHYYTDVAGLNPITGQAIELAPYRCSSDADALTSLDEAVKLYQKDHPPGSAPDPGTMPAFKPGVEGVDN